MRAFVSGATGYIGSRLIPTLLQQGHDVVAGMRNPDRASDYAWADQVDVAEFDIEDEATVRDAVAGCDTAYFLVHSMSERGFQEKDARGARNFAAACDDAGVSQIVYLSGLVPEGTLSDHLASRLEVEQILLDAARPATVLRAAIILGAGSTSFELVRQLVERLPVIPVPTWMNRRRVQPIATDDVVDALARAGSPEKPWNGHRDLGGREQLTYPDLVTIVADELGLYRPHVPIPPVPRTIVGRTVAGITGIPANTVVELIKSLSHDMVCVDQEGLAELGETLSVREAVRRAVRGAATGTLIDGDRQTLAPSDPEWAGGARQII